MVSVKTFVCVLLTWVLRKWRVEEKDKDILWNIGTSYQSILVIGGIVNLLPVSMAGSDTAVSLNAS